jgi:hypothetical protein
MKKKLSLSFKDYRDEDLNVAAIIIVSKMTGNENFPDAVPLVNELTDLSRRYLDAMSAASLRDMEKVAIKNQLRGHLIRALKQLGLYVTLVAKGNNLLLLSSGFPLTKPKGETVLSEPQEFKVSAGRYYGEVILKVKRVPGAKSYLYQYTPDPLTEASVWKSVIGTRCKITIKDLPLGQKIWFQMAAIGPNEQVVYTAPVWRYIS